MAKYLVIVENSNSFADVWLLFWKYGIRKDRERGVYSGCVSKRRYASFGKFCQKRHLRYHIDEPFGLRSGDYRNRFFDAYSPAFGNYYFCAYCGRLIHISKVTVDHLIPIGRVNKSPKLQKKLKRRGYTDVNDPRNLVAACMSCNMRKGTKTKGWLLKGRIGRYKTIWVIRHIVRLAVICFLLWYLYPYFIAMIKMLSSILSSPNNGMAYVNNILSYMPE